MDKFADREQMTQALWRVKAAIAELCAEDKSTLLFCAFISVLDDINVSKRLEILMSYKDTIKREIYFCAKE